MKKINWAFLNLGQAIFNLLDALFLMMFHFILTERLQYYVRFDIFHRIEWWFGGRALKIMLEF